MPLINLLSEMCKDEVRLKIYLGSALSTLATPWRRPSRRQLRRIPCPLQSYSHPSHPPLLQESICAVWPKWTPWRAPLLPATVNRWPASEGGHRGARCGKKGLPRRATLLARRRKSLFTAAGGMNRPPRLIRFTVAGSLNCPPR